MINPIARAFFLTPLLGLVVASTALLPAHAQSLDESEGAIEITEPPSGNAPNNAQRRGKAGQPRVGRKAAEKYMRPRQDSAEDSSPRERSSPAAHYLALHLGTFVSDTAYKWGGADTIENVGKWNVGVTYRVGEWVNSMDMTIRLDLASYSLPEGRATKLAIMPLVTFPDASSKFPLYFGMGIGPGVFIHQVSKESPIALDYQLLAGARFFELIESTGFFIEAGLKNHLLALSDGQFNGTFAAIGAVFTF